MRRRQFTAAGLTLSAAATLGAPARAQGRLGESDAAMGVRAALERGALAAVASLGRADGFLGDPAVRIGLPKALDDAARLLRATGQGASVDELVTAMNRAAETAVPVARPVFVQAVKALSIEDALALVRGRGGETGVTQFFAGKTRTPLATQFLPIVTQATERLQLAQRYNRLAGRAQKLGLVGEDEAKVQRWVTVKALDGLFHRVGEEERRIRADPAGTGSALLRKVFGG